MNLKCLIYFACATLATASFAADISYRSDIRPLIKDKCLGCHGDESPALVDFLQEPQKYKKEMQGPRLSTYGKLIQVIGWPETGVFMRRLDDGSHSTGKKSGNMYRYLGDTDAERATNLNIIKTWLGEGAWNLNPWEKADDVPAIAKDQMDKLKLNY